MRRWLVAVAALLVGGGVSAALLVAGDPGRGTSDVYAAARDVPAGSMLTRDALQLERVSVAAGTSLLFTSGDGSELTGLRAAHDLASGQLIQRTDVMAVTSFADRRLVFIPLGEVPAAPPGSKVDLLVIGGSADHPSVAPFAIGVEVEDSVAAGIVVTVPSREAAAFVFAASTMRLVAVVAEPGAADGVEIPISSPDEAEAVVAQP